MIIVGRIHHEITKSWPWFAVASSSTVWNMSNQQTLVLIDTSTSVTSHRWVTQHNFTSTCFKSYWDRMRDFSGKILTWNFERKMCNEPVSCRKILGNNRLKISVNFWLVCWTRNLFLHQLFLLRFQSQTASDCSPMLCSSLLLLPSIKFLSVVLKRK